MRLTVTLIVALAYLHPALADEADEWERTVTEIRLRQALASKENQAGITSDNMFDLCIPTWKRKLGRYTDYYFMFNSGWGISVVAKDAILQSAIEHSCIARTYFNVMTPEDAAEYQRLVKQHSNIPYERLIGRWGWERPRIRLMEAGK